MLHYRSHRTNFGQGLTGTTAVIFNGVSATTFKIVSDTVPDGCSSERRDHRAGSGDHSRRHADEQQEFCHQIDAAFEVTL